MSLQVSPVTHALDLITYNLNILEKLTKSGEDQTFKKIRTESNETLQKQHEFINMIRNINTIFSAFLPAIPLEFGGKRLQILLWRTFTELRTLTEKANEYRNIPNFLNCIESIVENVRALLQRRNFAQELTDARLQKLGLITYKHPQCDLLIDDFTTEHPNYSYFNLGYGPGTHGCIAVGYRATVDGQPERGPWFLPSFAAIPFALQSPGPQDFFHHFYLVRSIWLRFELTVILSKASGRGVEEMNWIQIQEVDTDNLLIDTPEPTQKSASSKEAGAKVSSKEASEKSGSGVVAIQETRPPTKWFQDYLAKHLHSCTSLSLTVAKLAAEYAINNPLRNFYYADIEKNHVYSFLPRYMPYPQIQQFVASSSKISVEEALEDYSYAMKRYWEGTVKRRISPEEINQFVLTCFSRKERHDQAISGVGAHNRFGVVFPGRTFSSPAIKMFRESHGWPLENTVSYLYWAQPNSSNIRLYPATISRKVSEFMGRQLCEENFTSTNVAISFDTHPRACCGGFHYTVNKEQALETSRPYSEFPLTCAYDCS